MKLLAMRAAGKLANCVCIRIYLRSSIDNNDDDPWRDAARLTWNFPADLQIVRDFKFEPSEK